MAEQIEKKNDDILRRLNNEGLIDYIFPHGRVPYAEFNSLKKKNGLNLSRVNSAHNDVKHYITRDMKNVSTKYINYYVKAFCYLRNWSVDKGMYLSSFEDAESIFIELLKLKANFTSLDIADTEYDLSKPSYRANRILREKTIIARRVTGNIYFKFDEEDGFATFNKRKFLESLKLYQLKLIAKELKVPLYPTMKSCRQVIRIVEKYPNIEEVIFKFIHNNKLKQISDEDMIIINSRYN